MSVARLLSVAAVLFLGVAPAIAGPVWVTYQFDSVTVPGPDVPAGYVKLDQHYSGRIDASTPRPIAQFRFIPSYPAGAGGISSDTRSDGSFTDTTRFAVAVQLTDESSGDVGTVKVTGSVQSTWTRMPDGKIASEGAAFLFDAVDRQDLLLGGKSFNLDLIGGSNTTGNDISASILVRMDSPSILSAPEPGTLVLGGIGLMLGGFAARRKRRLTPSS